MKTSNIAAQRFPCFSSTVKISALTTLFAFSLIAWLNACGSGQASTPEAKELGISARQLDKKIVDSGAQRVGKLLLLDNLRPEKYEGLRTRATGNTCYLAWAKTTTSDSIRIDVVDPQGSLYRNPHAISSTSWIKFCAQSDGTHLLRISKLEGRDIAYTGLYQIEQNTNPAAFFEDEANVVSIPGDATVRELEASGFYEASGMKRSYPLGKTGTKRDRFPTSSNTCYAIVISSGKVDSLNLELFDENGKQVGTLREWKGGDQVFEYCANRAGVLSLQVESPSERADVTVRMLSQQEKIKTTSGESQLDARIKGNQKDMSVRGYEKLTFKKALGGMISEGKIQQQTLRLPASSCYAFGVTTDTDLRSVHLSIQQKSTGRTLDRDVEHANFPTVRVCIGEEPTEIVLRVKAHSGSGEFQVTAYKWPNGTSGPYDLQGVIYVRLAEMAYMLSARGWEMDFSSDAIQGDFVANEPIVHEIDLPQSQCFTVLAVGDENIFDMSMKLEAPDGETIEDSTATAFPYVDLCTTVEGIYKLHLKGDHNGRYHVQLFVR